MSDDDLQALWDELDGGRAALLVVCNANETEATMEYLVAAGGKPRSHQLSSPDLEEAAKAADSSVGVAYRRGPFPLARKRACRGSNTRAALLCRYHS